MQILPLLFLLLPATALKILFVGNSLTYVNNLPEHLLAIGNSNGSVVQFEVYASVAGGAFIKDHYNEDTNTLGLKTLTKIRDTKADYVVLQEQSGGYMDMNSLYNYAPFQSPKTYTELLVDRVLYADSIPVFFMNWAMCTSPAYDEDTSAIAAAFVYAANKTSSGIIPSAYAMQKLMKLIKTSACTDAIHPSHIAQIVNGYLLYATFTNHSPIGLGNVFCDIQNITPYQEIAWQVYTTYRSNYSNTNIKFFNSSAASANLIPFTCYISPPSSPSSPFSPLSSTAFELNTPMIAAIASASAVLLFITFLIIQKNLNPISK